MFSYSTLLLGISLTALTPLLSRRAAIGFVAIYLAVIAAMGLSPAGLPLLLRPSESEMLLTAGLVNVLAVFRLVGTTRASMFPQLADAGLVALLAACWTVSLTGVGLSLELAMLLALLLPAVALQLLRRPSFAPTVLRREAQLLSAVLCLAAVFVMEALAGWRQFTALQAELPGVSAANATTPLLLVAAAFALGLAWQGWRVGRKL